MRYLPPPPPPLAEAFFPKKNRRPLTDLAFFTNSLRHGDVSPLATSAPFDRSTRSSSTASNASPRSRRYQPALILPVPVAAAAEGGVCPTPVAVAIPAL